MYNRECNYITVQLIDTIQTITEKYNTTIEELIQLNPNLDFENLEPGTEICVPIPVCPIGSIPYEIKTGDTLGNIAASFYTTVETILQSNPGLDPNNLVTGKTICIFQPKPEVAKCPSLNIYVIRPGDRIYTIAAQFGLSIEEILRVNPDLDIYNLKVDDVICLPLTPTPYVIVINTKNKLLYLYYLGKLIKPYSVAVGKPSTPTPLGNFFILNKQVNPGGPFGTRWMGLSKPSYGIHGTNNPASIGTQASNGCIRMFNEDVENLFSLVSINTPVIII